MADWLAPLEAAPLLAAVLPWPPEDAVPVPEPCPPVGVADPVGGDVVPDAGGEALALAEEVLDPEAGEPVPVDEGEALPPVAGDPDRIACVPDPVPGEEAPEPDEPAPPADELDPAAGVGALPSMPDEPELRGDGDVFPPVADEPGCVVGVLDVLDPIPGELVPEAGAPVPAAEEPVPSVGVCVLPAVLDEPVPVPDGWAAAPVPDGPEPVGDDEALPPAPGELVPAVPDVKGAIAGDVPPLVEAGDEPGPALLAGLCGLAPLLLVPEPDALLLAVGGVLPPVEVLLDC